MGHELCRYSVDFAALSETRFSGEGSITEGDPKDGYTIFWRGYSEGEPRMHGVGLAIKNIHMKNIDEEPNFISERLMTLRVPLVKNDHLLLICAYVPTLVAEENVKDQFYEELDRVLRRADGRDKIVLLGDFNARVSDRSAWARIAVLRRGPVPPSQSPSSVRTFQVATFSGILLYLLALFWPQIVMPRWVQLPSRGRG